MKLDLIRRRIVNGATEGDLQVDGAPFCHTLEDVVRPLGPQGQGKVYGQTAIPAGTYGVILNMSPRLKKIMPRLVGVPGFDGILIHKGNGPEDTLGCILVGDQVAGGRIPPGESTPAFFRLMDALNAAKDRGETITITITEALEVAAHA